MEPENDVSQVRNLIRPIGLASRASASRENDVLRNGWSSLRFRVGVPHGSGLPLHETGGFVSRNKGLVKSYPNEFLTCRNMDGIDIFTYLWKQCSLYAWMIWQLRLSERINWL